MRFNSVGDTINNLPDIRRTLHHHLMFSSHFQPCKMFECIHSHHSREVADAGTLGAGESCAIGCSFIIVAACGRPSILVVGPWMLVSPCCHPSILVVGPCGQLMVVVGTHCVLWGCEKRGVVMCDIVFITSPNWDVPQLFCSSHP